MNKRPIFRCFMLDSMKGLLRVMLLLFATTAAGQKNLQITSGSDYKRPDAGLRSIGGNSMSLSYRHEAFLNNTYHQFKEKDIIGSNYGVELSCQVFVFGPFALEAIGFLSLFDAKGITDSKEEEEITHSGIEAFANVYPMPYIGKISNIVAPYAGIGYQTSSLSGKGDTSAGTSSAMFKVGMQFKLTRSMSIHGEYKQTLPTSSNKLFRVLDFGLGVHF